MKGKKMHNIAIDEVLNELLRKEYPLLEIHTYLVKAYAGKLEMSDYTLPKFVNRVIEIMTHEGLIRLGDGFNAVDDDRAWTITHKGKLLFENGGWLKKIAKERRDKVLNFFKSPILPTLAVIISAGSLYSQFVDRNENNKLRAETSRLDSTLQAAKNKIIFLEGNEKMLAARLDSLTRIIIGNTIRKSESAKMVRSKTTPIKNK